MEYSSVGVPFCQHNSVVSCSCNSNALELP